jgi:hypothetical protein
MTASSSAMLEVKEKDQAGRLVATYAVSEDHDGLTSRVDVIHAVSTIPFSFRFLSVLLPTGYPHTVSPDYTAYQIYDSLQAFSSSIAGLLASRAVLQGIGVGDESASPTAAMLLSVLQESMGRVATIFFADHFGKSIEAECKMFRLAADVFNDIAIISDCLSPILPKSSRVLMFCISSIFRAVCGVAGGSSKAILSSHFAKADNIGELNAKDSSQETVISLLGMWAGGLIVSRISSLLATWIWLIFLLSVHLGTNYAAVRSVCLHSLNRQRANISFSILMATGVPPKPDFVANRESIFHQGRLIRWQCGKILGACRIGSSISELLLSIAGTRRTDSGAITGTDRLISSLLNLFSNEDYVLWFNPVSKHGTIVLNEAATARTQLKAWAHALRVAYVYDQTDPRKRIQENTKESPEIAVMRDTLQEHNSAFPKQLKQLEDVGWDVDKAILESKPGKRFALDTQHQSLMTHQSSGSISGAT